MTALSTIVSICGQSCSGKSQLAKAVAAALGDTLCARIPTDYFLVLPDAHERESPPRKSALITYDWDLLDATLCRPLHTTVTTPDVDFERMTRRSPMGGLPFTIRPIVLTDGFAPHPNAAIRIRLTAADPIRRARLVDRDARWDSRVSDRWALLEATWAAVDSPERLWDLDLSGEVPLAENAQRVATYLAHRLDETSPCPGII